jgi:hypothetical protein
MLRLLFFAPLIIGIASCSSSRREAQAQMTPSVVQETETKSPSDTAISYSRGACFGMCPIFDLVVMKDGKASYLGKNNVNRIGRFEARVSFSDIQLIQSKAREIGYFELLPVYDNEGVHDLPNITTGISDGKHVHRVRNRYKGPAALRYLYTELDSLIERQSWKAAGNLQQD